MTSHHHEEPQARALGPDDRRAEGSGPRGAEAGWERQGSPQGAARTPDPAGAGTCHHAHSSAVPPGGTPGYTPEGSQQGGFMGYGMGGPPPAMGPYGYGGVYAAAGPYHHGGVGGYPGQPLYGYPPYPPYPPQGGPHPWAGVPRGPGHGLSELMDDALKGDVNPSKLGHYLNDGEFIKGALVGAAVVLLLTDNPLRQALFRGTAKAAEKVKEGYGQVKQAVGGKTPEGEAKTEGEALGSKAD